MVGRRTRQLLQRGLHRAASRVAEHHHESGAEPLGGELDAADLRRSSDVSRHADDEQIPQPLVEDDLCRRPRIGASENDGEGLLAVGHRLAARLVGELVAGAGAGDKPPVALAQTSECFVG